jgi:hypothetical protein
VLFCCGDPSLQSHVVGQLWMEGFQVQTVAGLPALAQQFATDSAAGAFPDVVVWDVALGSLLELDRVWRRFAEGVDLTVVAVDHASHSTALHHGVHVCAADPRAIVAAVEAALPTRSGTRRKATSPPEPSVQPKAHQEADGHAAGEHTRRSPEIVADASLARLVRQRLRQLNLR